jgi:hypothetical protein
LVGAGGGERIAVAAEEAPRVFRLVLVVDADDRRKRLSCASCINSGASSWHGTHHDAQTFTTVTAPLKLAGLMPGKGVPLRSRPATGGKFVCGAGWPMSADGMCEGSPE